MNFEQAFNLVMKSEVGPNWDPTDPDVIAGKHDTSVQCKKIGFTDIKDDRGGLTAYGIAQNPNPNIDVRSLNLVKATEFYKVTIWDKLRTDELPPMLRFALFDAAVQHGNSRAVKFLQESIGGTVDGIIGRDTITLANLVVGVMTAKDVMTPRTKFYEQIVRNDPSQAKFKKGWDARVQKVMQQLK